MSVLSIRQFLTENIAELEKPQYSPERDPCDVFLFWKLKRITKGSFWRRDHQKVHDDEAEWYPGSILPVIHRSMTDKDGKVLKTRGQIWNQDDYILFGSQASIDNRRISTIK